MLFVRIAMSRQAHRMGARTAGGNNVGDDGASSSRTCVMNLTRILPTLEFGTDKASIGVPLGHSVTIVKELEAC
jgi:hypothetical protein